MHAPPAGLVLVQDPRLPPIVRGPADGGAGGAPRGPGDSPGSDAAVGADRALATTVAPGAALRPRGRGAAGFAAGDRAVVPTGDGSEGGKDWVGHLHPEVWQMARCASSKPRRRRTTSRRWWWRWGWRATPKAGRKPPPAGGPGEDVRRWLGKQGFAGEVEDTVEDEGDALGILQLASVSGTVATGERAGRRVKRVTMLGGKEFALGPRCAANEGRAVRWRPKGAQGRRPVSDGRGLGPGGPRGPGPRDDGHDRPDEWQSATDRVELERLCRYILRPLTARSGARLRGRLRDTRRLVAGVPRMTRHRVPPRRRRRPLGGEAAGAAAGRAGARRPPDRG